MLVLWDCGYHGYPLLWDLKQTGADLLAALPSEDRPEIIARLSDGSSLVRVWKRKGSRKDPPRAHALDRVHLHRSSPARL